MQELLTLIVTWLAINFGLPAYHEHPRVEFVSAAEMLAVRHSRLAPDGRGRVAADAAHAVPIASGHSVHAIYDDRSRTIFLPKNGQPHHRPMFRCWYMNWSTISRTSVDSGTTARQRANGRPTGHRRNGWNSWAAASPMLSISMQ